MCFFTAKKYLQKQKKAKVKGGMQWRHVMLRSRGDIMAKKKKKTTVLDGPKHLR